MATIVVSHRCPGKAASATCGQWDDHRICGRMEPAQTSSPSRSAAPRRPLR